MSLLTQLAESELVSAACCSEAFAATDFSDATLAQPLGRTQQLRLPALALTLALVQTQAMAQAQARTSRPLGLTSQLPTLLLGLATEGPGLATSGPMGPLRPGWRRVDEPVHCHTGIAWPKALIIDTMWLNQALVWSPRWVLQLVLLSPLWAVACRQMAGRILALLVCFLLAP